MNGTEWPAYLCRAFRQVVIHSLTGDLFLDELKCFPSWARYLLRYLPTLRSVQNTILIHDDHSALLSNNNPVKWPVCSSSRAPAKKATKKKEQTCMVLLAASEMEGRGERKRNNRSARHARPVEKKANATQRNHAAHACMVVMVVVCVCFRFR